MKRTIFVFLLLSYLLLPFKIFNAAEERLIYKPNISTLAKDERLSDEIDKENSGFAGDGNGGFVSMSNNEYNASYFGTTARQFHYHAEMEPVVPGTNIVGGLSFKHRIDGDRFDLAITTGGLDKSILIYAAGMLLADNRNDAQGGLGGLSAFNNSGKIVIDLYGDRNYYAVFINGTIVIETVLPLEGSGLFGVRSHNSLVRYSNIYINELGDTLLDGRARYYEETFENVTLSASKLTTKTNELVTFTASLSPEGKDYSNVYWQVNGVRLIDESNLIMNHSFDSEGEYTVRCVVDGRFSSVTIIVSAGSNGGEPNNKLLLILGLSFCGIATIAGVFSLLRFLKKKKATNINK